MVEVQESVKQATAGIDRRLAYAFVGLASVLVVLLGIGALLASIAAHRAERERLCTVSASLLAPGVEAARASGRFRVQSLVDAHLADDTNIAYIVVRDREGVVAQAGLEVPSPEGFEVPAQMLVRERTFDGVHVSEVLAPLEAGYDGAWEGELRIGIAGESLAFVAFRTTLPVTVLLVVLLALAWPIALRLGKRFGAPVRATEAARKRLAIAVESIGEGLALVRDGRIYYANPALGRLLGTSAVGRGLVETFAADEEAEGIVASLLRGDAQRARFRAQGPEATWLCDVSVTPLAQGTVWVLRNVERETTLEHQLRQAQKMEAIGQLAGGVAHDFNNLLAVIASAADLLAMAEPEGESAEMIGMIRKASDRGADLTQQILAFARRQVLRLEDVDPGPVVAETVQMLTRILGQKVSLDMELQDELWSISADTAQLQQVLMNLAINARDAMPEGGTLRVELANRELPARPTADGREMPPGQYVVLSVSDTGVGIDEQALGHIFEPFFTTKALGEGTGLGLSTVIGIVQQLGGYIWVASTKGRGTVFHIAIPRGDVAKVERESRPSWQPRELGAKVLLVEDQDELRETLTRLLQREGFEVVAVASGEAALASFEEHAVDVVLSDLAMPGMDGASLLNQVRSRAPTLPLLLMSGYGAELGKRRKELVGVPILRKPLGRDELLEAIDKAIATARRRRENLSRNEMASSA